MTAQSSAETPDARAAPPRVRVLIIGGGCAGLAAAWELAKQPNYEIHVYEQTWRLGGKGASVRDDRDRILEHGLHVWLGFYENAFRMMRECYRQVQRKRWGPGEQAAVKLTHASIDDAFFPEPSIGVADPEVGDAWSVWSGLLPPAKGLPGEPLDEASNPFTLRSYVLRCFDLLRALMTSVIGPPADDSPAGPRAADRSSLDQALDLDFSFDPGRSPAAFIDSVGRLLRNSVLTTAAGLLQAVTILENALQKFNYAPQVADSILGLMEAVASQARKQLRDLVAVDPRLRRKTEIIDIVMTIAFGLWRDRVLFDERGLDAINHIDYRDWLLQHGATNTSVNSPFMQGIYDLVFAYRDGDAGRPALAAGVALRGALRMFFTYRGAMFWRMRSGMGEAVFAPLYEVLRRCFDEPRDGVAKPRVTFHFLHELTDVGFDFSEGDRPRLVRLEFCAYGDPDALSTTPALDARGRWPAERDACFGPAGATTTVVRNEGEHFDVVVFAAGFHPFVRVMGRAKLFDRIKGKWPRMRDELQTVATKAAQVWLSKSLDALGWHRGSGIVTALGLSFQTWADMTHTLAMEERPRERAPGAAAVEPKSVAYFCGVLRDDAGPRRRNRQLNAVNREVDALLGRGMRGAWPAAFDGSHTARSAEIDRHVQVNTEGSERYTLSVPGTPDARISPLDNSVYNMAIAGDWTANGFDAGCVEAAVMSGMLAAHAISGKPEIKAITGYDHP